MSSKAGSVLKVSGTQTGEAAWNTLNDVQKIKADLVIDGAGWVIKDRGGYVNRKATDQELREAELV